jgi:hypothetical protein
MARKTHKALSVGRSHVGRTVVSRLHFRPEELIAKITGRIIRDPDYGSDYCMDLGGGTVIEPDAPFRYLNHSCDPNCELVQWEDEESREVLRLCLHARREVRPGDELTIDYAWSADAAIPCKCGSPECRGWIVSPEEVHQLETAP